jgi:hypothetical protein
MNIEKLNRIQLCLLKLVFIIIYSIFQLIYNPYVFKQFQLKKKLKENKVPNYLFLDDDLTASSSLIISPVNCGLAPSKTPFK